MTYPEFTPEQIKRFWSYVDKQGPDDCWNWTGEFDRHGRGSFRIRRGGKRPRFIAARVAYILANETIPQDMNVCHTCDNGRCCNPVHLWPGTQRDNIRDCMAKGRFSPPPPRSHVKLSEAKVIDIRRRYAEGGTTYTKLGEEFGVSRDAIFMVVHRRVWKDVD